MGIIASVLVSFTVTALSRVALPRFHMLSHVEAHAVTDEVSFTAVPAKIPKGVPSVVLNPIALPRSGNMIAARTLKKNMTLIACATSSSSAPITGAVAAIAEPPHIEEPTPISVAVLPFILSAFDRRYAVRSDTVIVDRIIGSDCSPVSATTERFMPKPRRITAHCSIFFDVNLMPGAKLPWSLKNTAMTMPSMIAMTGPPMIGNSRPRIYEGIAIRSERITPFHIVLISVMPRL